MIPVSLTIQGIYSYREKHTILFEPLTNAGIFGIFGAVGSGKSTILEAISFALYGETERLNKRDDRAYNMMNLTSKELYIDFVFRTGAEDQEYRFVVKGKRNRKNFEKVTTLDRTAYMKTASGWEPIDPDATESILQLSYENFRRTIIIPQGKFQEFLELTDSERTRMMKELFHLQKFELSEKVSILEKRNIEQIIRLEERIQQTGTATEEEIARNETALSSLKLELEKSNLRLVTLQTSEQQLSQLKKLFSRIIEQRESLRLLQEQETEMKVLEQQISLYEFCMLHLKPLFDRRKEMNDTIIHQTSLLENQQQQEQHLLINLSEAEKKFPVVKDAFENRSQLKEKSEELEKIIHLKKLQKNLLEVNDRIKNGTAYLLDAETEISKLQKQQQELKENAKVLKQHLPDVMQLSAVSNWFQQKKIITTNIDNIRIEQNTISEKSVQLTTKRNEQLPTQLKKLLPGLDADEATTILLKQINEAMPTFEKALEKARNELEHLQLRNQLEEYATALQPGEPCPLCGSVHHPQIFSSESIKQELKKANAGLALQQKSIDVLTKAIQQLEIIENSEASLAEQLKQWQAKLQKEERALQQHLDSFSWEPFRELKEKSVDQLLAEAAAHKKNMEEVENKLEKTAKEIEKKIEKNEFAKSRLADLKNEQTNIIAQLNLLESQLKWLNIADYDGAEQTSIEKEIQILTSAFIDADKKYHALDEQLQLLRKSAGELKGNIASGSATLTHAKEAIKTVEDAIRHVTSESGIDEKQGMEMLASGFNISKAKNSLSGFQQRLHTALKLLEESEKEAAGKAYDESSHLQLISDIAQATDSQEHQLQRRAVLTAATAQLRQQLEQRIKLQVELNTAQLRGDELTTLRNLFKASGFVNYVSAVHLQQLCNAANERFYKLTHQKLQLEVNNNNNFEVRDFMNNGQTRSVKTLSGGQKFQAALSLALALADSIQIHSRARQNFFFLDEGFGSLDTASLETVFETLRSLRKENRIVGIISHVQEMQQEIDTCLMIVNEEETGSRIKANW